MVLIGEDYFAYLVAFDCALDTAGDNVAEVLDSLIFGEEC